MDIAARILNASLMIAMPLGLGVLLARKLNVEWRLFGVGAATFAASQVVHIPFNTWVLSPMIQSSSLSNASQGIPLALLALLYGLSAGVFEEASRYLAYRFWIRDARSWGKALMFGAGHGGIEAMLLGGLAFYALIQALALRNVDLASVVPPEQLAIAKAQLEAYWGASWYASLLGAVERAATLPFHLSAAVLVLRSLTRRNPFWLGAAIGWHTALNAAGVFAAQAWNVYVAEALIVLLGLASLGLVFLVKEAEAAPSQSTPKDGPPPVEIQPSEPSLEQLEDSRYA